MKRVFLMLLVPGLFLSQITLAQDGNQPVSYANLALQFSTDNFNGDPVGIFPGVASSEGFGSYIDNPAGVALLKENYFNFGLYNNNVEYQNTYLGNTVESSDNSTNLGNIGMVYKIPTQQGSFVVGAGYNRITNSRGISRLSARNNQSTITDNFREPGSDYQDIAFNAYAIDWGDTDSTYLESIFRIGFENYPGITQEAEISQVTNIGEYSFFFGTEFQENLYVGVSAGITSGSYTYRRDFLEIDEFNDYNSNFIPSDTEGEFTDVDNILTHDEIDADIVGFSLRTGLIYTFSERLNVGISYKLPSTLIVRENYYSSITTELDDGSQPFQSDFSSDGAYEYRVKSPGQLNAGFTISKIGKFSFSAAGTIIDYSNIELDFITGNDLSFNDEVALREQEDEVESFISSSYKLVTNWKAGIQFDATEQLNLKAGYSYLPGRSKVFEADRNVLSAGFTTQVTESIVLDVSGQYSFWKDRSEVYNYYDYQDDVSRAETMAHDVNNLKILAGIRFKF